jgi:predicted anti-sigma-YlaC factor YlaD
MNCNHVREHLPELLYESLPPAEAAQLKYHLALCPGCREQYAALERVRGLLDQVPAPEIPVDLPLLYRQAAQGQERRMRRWRRAAFGLVGIAAALLVVVGLRLEVRLEAHQVVVRWGNAPAPDNSPSATGQNPGTGVARGDAKEPPVSQQEFQTLRELIYSLASNAETTETRFAARDQQRQEEIIALRERLKELRSLLQKQWSETRSYVSALSAQFGSTEKGAKQ